MVWAKCDSGRCIYNRDGLCHLHQIELEDGICTKYKGYSDDNPLYQNVFFKRCRTLEGGKTLDYRVASKGMRYEWNDLVLYTESDIRNGINHATFTEEITGLLVNGYDMEHTDRYYEYCKKKLRDIPPVMTFPLYDVDKATGKIVPHTEN